MHNFIIIHIFHKLSESPHNNHSVWKQKAWIKSLLPNLCFLAAVLYPNLLIFKLN